LSKAVETVATPNLEGFSSLELRNLCKTWKKRSIEFIDNPEFAEPDAGGKIFAEPLNLAPRQNELGVAAIRKSGADLPVHLGRLCEAPLLTPVQEKQLFERMNFLFHQAAQHQSLLNVSRPSKARLELIQKYVLLAEWHRDRIVEANLRLVFSIVKKFVNVNNNFDDLLSDGIIGLIRAVEKFDFGRGFRFSTYATQVVRRNSYRLVSTSQEERQTVLNGFQDMETDVCEVGRHSAISIKRWHELRSRLAILMDELDRREKVIIRARFALGPHRKVRTLQSLANRLGISKERVRQLEGRAMKNLQTMANSDLFPPMSAETAE
jgi:RNA polymerase primary sigma factor